MKSKSRLHFHWMWTATTPPVVARVEQLPPAASTMSPVVQMVINRSTDYYQHNSLLRLIALSDTNLNININTQSHVSTWHQHQTSDRHFLLSTIPQKNICFLLFMLVCFVKIYFECNIFESKTNQTFVELVDIHYALASKQIIFVKFTQPHDIYVHYDVRAAN